MACGDLPEHARFLDVTLDLDTAETGTGILHCARSTGDVDGGFEYERHNFEVSEIAARMGDSMAELG